MTKRSSEPDAVDQWLRDELEPEREAAQRLSAKALRAKPAEHHSFIRSRWALLAATALVVVLLVSIWTRSGDQPTAREPIRITNFGTLVTTVDPAGDVWLHAQARMTDADSPRLIITLGGENAN